MPSPPTDSTQAITLQDFRDYWVGVFSDSTAYPDAWVQTYIAFAVQMMNANRWRTNYWWGMQLFVAHYVTLFKRAVQAQAVGGSPGLAKGVINSETPGTVSLSYDTVLAGEERGGNWNLTQWGQQYLRMARLVGMGPIQLNVGDGGPAGAVLGQMGAWPGPSTGSGFSF